MGAFDLLAKAAKGAKKAAPFFSKADVVLDELQRGKGAGNEFLGELVKKGAKPTELKERGIEKALKDKPKMTKAEVQKIFESNPPPRVQEKVLSSDVPDYDEWLENKAQEIYGVDWFDLRKDEQKALNKMYGDLDLTQYDRYKTPGGENYREILLKLPQAKSEREVADENLKAFTDRVSDRLGLEGWDFDSMTPSELVEYETLNNAAMKSSTAQPIPYLSGHYKTDPNLLAHIRVQDYQVPSKGYAVVNTRSGNKSEVFPTIQEAHAAMFQYPENMRSQLKLAPAQGKPKKVLLVDEIQSDWHQEGRKRGYRGDQQRTPYDDPEYAQARERAMELGNEFNSNNHRPDRQAEIEPMLREARMAERAFTDRNNQIGNLIPDAPFKKNWHELAMKRVLDYAAENGYDSVAITPGVQQVKRYEDATRQAVDEVAMYGDTLVGFKNGRRVIEQPISSPDELEQYIGKEMAQKLSSAAPDMNFIRSIKGEDITVGGEGMKGFYDKILPDYLNNYGKKYGAQMGEMDLVTKPEYTGVNHIKPDEHTIYPAETMRFHSFDITPQMREEIRTKGQPLYGKVATPVLEGLAAGTGAATIAPEVFDMDNEQQVQNPVHFTENPDAMLLELMQRN